MSCDGEAKKQARCLQQPTSIARASVVGFDPRRGPAWAVPVSVYMAGLNVPPEMFDGIESKVGGVLRITRHEDGTYTVVHELGQGEVFLARRRDPDIARDQCVRCYGRVIQNVSGDLIGQHYKLVVAALEEGRYVPAEVLQDYPTLRPTLRPAVGATRAAD